MTLLFPISDMHVGMADYKRFPELSLLTDKNILATLDHLKDAEDAIVCVCGDIGERLLGVAWCERALRLLPNIRIVYTPGNHEFYGYNMDCLMYDLRCVSSTSDRLYILDGMYNNSFVIGDITFIGGTLWTDFMNQNQNVMNTVQRGMNDYKAIMSGGDNKPVTPNRILNEHYEQKKAIFRALDRCKTEKRVVITHHQPYVGTPIHGGSLDALSYGYQVDLEKELNECKNLPQFWFSGHTHVSRYCTRPYEHGVVEFVSNQYGYPTEFNTGYSELCTFEL
jgi:hypothetical protein